MCAVLFFGPQGTLGTKLLLLVLLLLSTELLLLLLLHCTPQHGTERNLMRVSQLVAASMNTIFGGAGLLLLSCNSSASAGAACASAAAA